MLERGRDLAAVVGYAVLAAGTVWAFHPGGVGGLLLAPLLVVCPGYALVRAIEGRGRVDLLELTTTTLALSFATAALGGLLLNTLGVRLTAHSWSALMLVVTAVAAVVAATRRAGADEPARRRSIPIRAMPLLATAAVCALLSVAALVAVRSQQAQDRRTATTALGVAASNGGSILRISVVNGGAGPTRYRMRIDVGGRITTFPLTLAGGAQWSGTRHISRTLLDPVRVQLFGATLSDGPLRTVMLP